MAGRLGMAAVAAAALSFGMAAFAPSWASPARVQPVAPEASSRVAGLERAFVASLEGSGRLNRAAVELVLLADIEHSGLEPQECRQALVLLSARPLTPAQRRAVQILADRIGWLLQGRPTEEVSLRGPVAPDAASVIVAGGPPPPSPPDSPDYHPGR